MRTFKVKEVREITGLTRKQLYDYQTSIPPVSTENNAGYKLYDQEGVNRLALAAMLSELGAGPKKINSIFGTDNYDVNHILDTLIDDAKRRREYYDDIIIVAETLRSLGAKNDAFYFNVFQIRDLHSIAKNIRKSNSLIESILKKMDGKNLLKRIRTIFGEFAAIRDTASNEKLLDLHIEKLLRFFEDELEINGFFGLTYISESILLIPDLSEDIDKKWGSGFSGFLLETILNYQSMRFKEDLLIFGENFDNVHGTEWDEAEREEVFEFIAGNITKWFGLDDYEDIAATIRFLALAFNIKEEINDPELEKLLPLLLHYLDSHKK